MFVNIITESDEILAKSIKVDARQSWVTQGLYSWLSPDELRRGMLKTRSNTKTYIPVAIMLNNQRARMYRVYETRASR